MVKLNYNSFCTEELGHQDCDVLERDAVEFGIWVSNLWLLPEDESSNFPETLITIYKLNSEGERGKRETQENG
jgi:hypothetical protein